MSIDLPAGIETELRTLAQRQGREVGSVVEDAVRFYLEASAITDLDASDIADAQAALLTELSPITD